MQKQTQNMSAKITTDLTKLSIDIDEGTVVVRGENKDGECLKAELNPDAPVTEAAESLRDVADDLEETGSGRFWAEEESDAV